MLEWLQSEIDSSEKLYLLHSCREPQKGRLLAALSDNGEDSETQGGNYLTVNVALVRRQSIAV